MARATSSGSPNLPRGMERSKASSLIPAVMSVCIKPTKRWGKNSNEMTETDTSSALY